MLILKICQIIYSVICISRSYLFRTDLPIVLLRVGHDWVTSLSLLHFLALEKEMAPHSSVLAWRIPGTGEPGGLPSMGLHRVGHDWSDLAAAAAVPIVHLFTQIHIFLWRNNLTRRGNPLLSSEYSAAAKSLESCLTLCNPIDGSPPGSAVPGSLQARTLEWVAISFSNVWKWKVKGKSLCRVQPSATSWTAAFQAPPSMGLSRQVYWSGVPSPFSQTSLVWCNFQ